MNAEFNFEKLEAMTDEQLVSLAQSGDVDAEHVLISREMKLVRIKAKSFFLAGADRSDLLQEGAIGLLYAIRKFDSKKNTAFRTFADVCIGRQLITAVKKSTRLKHAPLNGYVSLDRPAYMGDDSDEGDSIGEKLEMGSVQSPEEMAIEKESMRLLVAGMNRDLTELENKCLRCYLSGMSYREIAQANRIAQKTVDNALQRVKKKLVKLLEELHKSE